MEYIITAQITENYYEKSKPFIDSIRKYWKHKFVIGFIDFIPKDYNGDYYYMQKKNIYTYSENYPKNRVNFVCPQGGEFIDYLVCSDDDVIIQLDSDTIMQREMTEDELLKLIPEKDEIVSVYCAKPEMSLYQITKNLKFSNSEDYKYLENLYEFTGSILIANKPTFIRLRDYVISEWDEMIKVNEHHAGIQWVISKVSREHLKVRILDNVYQCGIWYDTFNTYIKNRKLYIDNDVVIFNHTQFNDYEFR